MNDTPAHFIAVCPSCLIGLKVNYEYSGRMVRCRHCDEAFRPFSPDFGSASGSAEYAVGPITAPEDRPDLVVSCPNCATTLSVRARYAGRHVRCGACRHKFRVDADAKVRSTPTDHDDPLLDDSDPVDHDERTPDPDVTRSDLVRLAEEVAELRERNDLLLGRQDELKREVEGLKAQVQQLEADREAAEGRIADLADHVGRNGRRATVPFLPERTAASGR